MIRMIALNKGVRWRKEQSSSVFIVSFLCATNILVDKGY